VQKDRLFFVQRVWELQEAGRAFEAADAWFGRRVQRPGDGACARRRALVSAPGGPELEATHQPHPHLRSYLVNGGAVVAAVLR
jgi:hypothetical protein